jgi:hypothetical protein
MTNKAPNLIEVERPFFVERAEEMLREIKDPVLLILKGHLLIEEALHECLCAVSHDPKFLEKANLRFTQKLYLVRALHEATPDRENIKIMMYDFAEALNMLRNRYAHNLEPKNITDIFPRLFIRKGSKNEHAWNEASTSDLMISIGICIGYFWSHAQSRKIPMQHI